MPRAPVLYRASDRSVVVFLAFGGNREDVADEQLRDELLVIGVHLYCAIHPTDALLDWRLGLDQYQRKTIYQQNQVGPAFVWPGAVSELLSNNALVLRQVVQVDQPHRNVLVVLAEGHGAFTTHPGRHLFIGADQAV